MNRMWSQDGKISSMSKISYAKEISPLGSFRRKLSHIQQRAWGHYSQQHTLSLSPCRTFFSSMLLTVLARDAVSWLAIWFITILCPCSLQLKIKTTITESDKFTILCLSLLYRLLLLFTFLTGCDHMDCLGQPCSSLSPHRQAPSKWKNIQGHIKDFPSRQAWKIMVGLKTDHWLP